MEGSWKSSALVELLLFSAGAVVFFEASVFIVIFVIPLAVLYRRRGFYTGLAGCLLTVCGIICVKLYHLLRISGAMRYDLLGIALVVPVSFLIGLAILEAPVARRLRTWQRLLCASLAGGLVYVPLLYLLLVSAEFDAMLRAQVDAMLRSFQTNEASLMPLVSAEQIVRLSRQVFLNTFLAGFFFTLAANWVIGVKMARRLEGIAGEFPAYRSFRMPEKAVYVFLGSWALVFATLFRDLGLLGVAAWNCALLVALLYMCQGVGIIKVRTEGLPRGFKMLVIVLCFTLIFTAGIVVILGIMAGVSLLGVSELWINYRKKGVSP